MRKKVLALGGLFLMFSGCKEDSSLNQAVYSETPRFYVNASLNGLPINMKAGEDGYQMYTSYEVKDSVLHMHGILAADSPYYREALMIDIHGSNIVLDAQNASAGNALQTGPIALSDLRGFTKQPNTYDYFFFADSASSHIPLQWITPDSTYYADSCAIWAINGLISPNFNVEMKSSAGLSCTPSVKHTIETGQECKAQIKVISSSSSELKAQIQSRIGRISSVNWLLNNQSVGGGLSIDYNFVGFQTSIKLKAVVRFQSGCTEVIEKTILVGGSNCDINIDYRQEEHRVANPNNLETVEIRYFDETGKMFSSKYANSQGSFIIESIGNYDDHSISTGTKKHQRFSFSGEAILKSADGSTLQLNSVFGSFAVAHP
jgi:hypothetical protein